MRALIVVLLAGCGLQDIGAGAGFNFDGLTGEVFVCEADVGDQRMSFELCWKDGDAGALEESLDRLWGNSSCAPTQRHLGPCLYQCPSATGCNSLNGCWCGK